MSLLSPDRLVIQLTHTYSPPKAPSKTEHSLRARQSPSPPTGGDNEDNGPFPPSLVFTSTYDITAVPEQVVDGMNVSCAQKSFDLPCLTLDLAIHRWACWRFWSLPIGHQLCRVSPIASTPFYLANLFCQRLHLLRH